jgi:hypothetical protein
MPASTSECADAFQGPGTSFVGAGTPAVSAPIEAKSAVGYGPVIYLALGTFAIGTEGFMIAAILPSVCRQSLGQRANGWPAGHRFHARICG